MTKLIVHLGLFPQFNIKFSHEKGECQILTSQRVQLAVGTGTTLDIPLQWESCCPSEWDTQFVTFCKLRRKLNSGNLILEER